MRFVFLFVWVSFLVYSVFLAPNEDSGVLKDLFTLNDPDPLLVSVFSMLGVWPFIYTLLLTDMDRDEVPAWPFAFSSFVIGAFGLLPYFILRRGKRRQTRRLSQSVQNALFKPGVIVTLFLLSAFLVGYGFIFGDLKVYQEAFRTSNFVHVMSVDFLILTGLSMYVIDLHEKETNQQKRGRFWYGALPIFGPLLYLGQVMRRR
ncbi:hypothetical protein N781_00990 [Pontibacillus halophilus JSM 076056 = DSM 19796]|uniref:DUF2834 domain-containing protein n=1 Tax=Pontibacillus halophilus JSM 076056 = DSM 19796 TaxID=1385510 RepID=A0A0A5GSE9_9BACI|nr:hypothetical protein [Pontibacillus halophilus]KGX94065.1 hypothetical protein N781_00990 [Pontibacillus halophilus JSM 076056 = DSM 19796]